VLIFSLIPSPLEQQNFKELLFRSLFYLFHSTPNWFSPPSQHSFRTKFLPLVYFCTLNFEAVHFSETWVPIKQRVWGQVPEGNNFQALFFQRECKTYSHRKGQRIFIFPNWTRTPAHEISPLQFDTSKRRYELCDFCTKKISHDFLILKLKSITCCHQRVCLKGRLKPTLQPLIDTACSSTVFHLDSRRSVQLSSYPAFTRLVPIHSLFKQVLHASEN
jgi:hypothetical protein